MELETIRRLTIEAKTDGVDAATDQLNKLSAAHKTLTDAAGVVGEATDTSAKRVLSAAGAYESLARKIDPAYAASLQFEKGQTTLKAALDQGIISHIEYASRLDQLGQKYSGANSGSQIWSKQLGVIQGQLVALSAGLGPVGTMLAAFGPWGLAAAAGVGAAVSVFDALRKSADDLASKAVSLSVFSDTVGLTTDQIQALSTATAKTGHSADDTQGAIEKFTVAWNQLRQGSGTALDQLRRVAPELVNQLGAAKSTADALNILSLAYEKVGDQAQKNALARAFFGRGGVSTGGAILSDISTDGIQSLTDDAKAAGDVIDKQLVTKLALLKVEIDETNTRAKNLAASLYSESVLEGELKWAQGLERAAKAAKDLADAQSGMSWWEGFLQSLATATVMNPATNPGVSVEQMQAVAAQRRFNANPEGSIYSSQFPSVGAAPPRPFRAGEGDTGPAATGGAPSGLAVTQMKEWVTLLGTAATATDKYNLKLTELRAAFDAGKFATKEGADAQELYTKALDAAKLDLLITQEGQRASILGASISVAEAMYQEQLKINKALSEGASLTPQEIDNQKRLTQVRALGTFGIQAQADALKVQGATLGMSVGDATAYKQSQDLINQALRDGKPLTDQNIADIQRTAKVNGALAQQNAEDAAKRTADFDLQKVFLSTIDQQTADVQRSLHGDGWQAFMNDGLSATMRLTDSLKTLQSVASNALTSFLSDLRSGKSPLDAFTNSLLKMSDQINTLALNKLVGAGGAALFGGAGANDNSAQVIAAGTAAGIKSANDAGMAEFKRNAMTPGYGVGAPGGVGQGPNYALAGVAAVGAGVGAYQGGVAAASPTQGALSGALMGGLSGAGLGFMIAGPVGALVGLGVGAIGGAGLGFLGGESGDASARTASDQQAQQNLNARLANYSQQYIANFFDQSTKAGALGAFDANANTQRQQEAAAGGQGIANLESTLALERLKIIKQFNDQAIAAQKTAEQTLSGTTLSAVDTAMANITAAGTSLSAALTDLGQSTDGVAAKVAAAVDKLRATFTDDLQRKIDDATGKGYLNSIRDLITETQQMASDAAKLGVDPSQIGVYLNDKAQSIVDAAGLSGSALADLTAYFPQFNGVVHDAASSLSAAATAASAAAAATAAFNKSITDYLASLQVGSLSTLSPQDQVAAAQSNFDAQLALARTGDTGAQNGITAAANTLLTTAQAFFASSAGYINIYNAVTAGLSGLVGHAGGGVVGYAGGGTVNGGIFGVDSVIAKLAGGEGIITANATRAIGGAPAIDFINRTGNVPSNDNADVVAELRNMNANLRQIMAAVAASDLGAVREQTEALQGTIGTLISATKTRANETPGTKRRA